MTNTPEEQSPITYSIRGVDRHRRLVLPLDREALPWLNQLSSAVEVAAALVPFVSALRPGAHGYWQEPGCAETFATADVCDALSACDRKVVLGALVTLGCKQTPTSQGGLRSRWFRCQAELPDLRPLCWSPDRPLLFASADEREAWDVEMVIDAARVGHPTRSALAAETRRRIDNPQRSRDAVKFAIEARLVVYTRVNGRSKWLPCVGER